MAGENLECGARPSLEFLLPTFFLMNNICNNNLLYLDHKVFERSTKIYQGFCKMLDAVQKQYFGVQPVLCFSCRFCFKYRSELFLCLTT